MRVRLLGPLDVVTGGVPRPVTGPRRRALLAMLALSAGAVVSTDRLIDGIWDGRPPATAMNTLQRHISYLRVVVGGREVIVARPPGYLLDLGPDGTDLQVFLRLVEQAHRAANPARKVARLQSALRLWRGPPLANVPGLTWLEDRAEWLAAVRLDVMEAAVDARLALGEHAGLVTELAELTRQHPYREHLHGQFMRALYQADRQADALDAYRRLRRNLADDLGLEPASAVRALHAAILRQDPSLDPSPEVGPLPEGVALRQWSADVRGTPDVSR